MTCMKCADQFESSTSPPGNPPGNLNFWRLACSNSLLSGQESRSNAPPISTELPLLRDKIGLQSNSLHAFQREICRNDTFNLLLKTLSKELFTNKGEILSCKSVRPRKNRKNSRAYYVRTRDKSGSNSPPFQRNVQIPPSPGTMHRQMPGLSPGGMLKFRIDLRKSPSRSYGVYIQTRRWETCDEMIFFDKIEECDLSSISEIVRLWRKSKGNRRFKI